MNSGTVSKKRKSWSSRRKGSDTAEPAPSINCSDPRIFFFTGLAGFSAGIAFWWQFSNPFLLLLLPFTPLLLLTRNRAVLLLFSPVFFFCLGNLRASATFFDPGVSVSGRARVSGIPQTYEYYRKAPLSVQESSIPLAGGIEARFDKAAPLYLFDKVEFAGTLRSPAIYRNFSYAPRFLDNYLSGRQYLKVSRLRQAGGSDFVHRLYEYRERLIGAFAAQGGDGSAFFSEVLFGVSALSGEERELFSATGTVHILSISGLHFAIMILFGQGLIYCLQQLFPGIVHFRPRPVLAAMAALPLLVLYAFLSGFSIPSARSFFTFLAVSLFLLLRRPASAFSLVSMLALLFLVYEPSWFFSISFQLSFICVFVLILFYSRIGGALERFDLLKGHSVPRHAAALLISSLVIGLFTFPFTQTLSPQSFIGGALANPVVIPVFSFIILPGLFAALPFALFMPRLFELVLLIPAAGWEILHRYLDGIYRLTSGMKLQLPMDAASTVIYYVTLVLVFTMKGWRRWACLAAGATVFLIFLPSPVSGPFVTWLDVGQGDGAAVLTRSGKLVLVDTGGNMLDPMLYQRAYRPFLDTLRKREIEAVIVSHAHPDHWAALPSLLRYYRLRHLYVPAGQQKEFFALWKQHDFQLHAVAGDTKLVVDEMRLTLLAHKASASALNNRSLWVLLESGSEKILFTGDTEKKYLPEMYRNPLLAGIRPGVMKLPHHGSRSSFDRDMYDQLRPGAVVIPVGSTNPWRLPSPEVVEHVRSRGIRVFRTDRDGQILFPLDGPGITAARTAGS